MFTRNSTTATKPLERTRASAIPLAGALPANMPRLPLAEPMAQVAAFAPLASIQAPMSYESEPIASKPAASPPIPTPASTGSSRPQPKSVISSDLVISGQQLRITARSLLQVDGAIEGDVYGTEIIIGEHGQVTGTVAADSIIVEGRVDGTIRGAKVVLRESSQVEGDIYHLALTIDRGAMFEGRARRAQDASELKADIQPAIGPRGFAAAA